MTAFLAYCRCDRSFVLILVSFSSFTFLPRLHLLSTSRCSKCLLSLQLWRHLPKCEVRCPRQLLPVLSRRRVFLFKFAAEVLAPIRSLWSLSNFHKKRLPCCLRKKQQLPASAVVREIDLHNKSLVLRALAVPNPEHEWRLYFICSYLRLFYYDQESYLFVKNFLLRMVACDVLVALSAIFSRFGWSRVLSLVKGSSCLVWPSENCFYTSWPSRHAV